MSVEVGAKSDVGRVRQANEDSYLVNEPIFVVADGMGGHVAGDIASSTAVDTIKQQADKASAENVQTLAELVRSANSRIWDKAQSDPTLRGMGTTCTLLMLDGPNAHIAHVGDSRAYLLRGGDFSQLTEDHSLVGRMVKEGRLTPEEAEHHPQRSIVTRALGVDSDVEVDLLSVDVVEGDRILLCSDGLTSMIDTSAIKEALETNADPQAAADRLVSLANDAGGEDNITVVVLDIGDTSTNHAVAPAAAGRAETTQTPTASGTEVPSSSGVTAARPAPVMTAERQPTPVPEELDSDDEDDEHPPYRHRRRWVRRLVVTLVVLAVLGGGAVYGVGYLLDNSWYVGTNDRDQVAIFNGIPEEVAGFSFSDQHEAGDIKLDDLPEFLQPNVEDGIKVDSLAEARTRLSDLEERAVREARPDRRPDSRKKTN